MKRHVIITGGSSGIGLAIAKLAAQRDDIQKVVLLARNLDKLNAARDSIQTDTEITVHSVDVTDATAVHECVDNIMNTDDDIATHVFCCAGEPHPAYFETISAPSYEHLVRINQLGSMYVANAFLKVMKLGTVQLCSSMGGQIGVFGFSAYAPTKFALRGYAECLHMELLHNPNVHIQVAYPPDTDTPGFAKENEEKPPETALISEAAGLSSAHSVAAVMLREALSDHPKFNIYFTFDGFLLSTLTAGFSPVTHVMDALAQLSALQLTRWIALLYLADWHRLIVKHKNGNKVSESKAKNE